MIETLSLSCVPMEEDCVQLGCENYMIKAMEECKRYIKLLESKFPETVGMYRVKKCPHDFGTYLDVEIVYKEGEEDIALHVENNLPLRWED